MSTDIQEESVVGNLPTPFEQEQIEWAERAIAGSTRAIQESLRHLVTLTTALLAGSAALLGRTSLPGLVLAGCAVLLTLSLSAALVGSWPVERTFDATSAVAIAEVRERLRVHKARYLKLSGAFLLATACVLIGGFFASLSH
jgi:hypothetical protein